MEKQFAKETERSTDCLDVRTRDKVTDILNNVLIRQHLVCLQDDDKRQEFSQFIAHQKVEDLQRYVALVRRLEHDCADTQTFWKQIIYDQGFRMLNDVQLAKKQFRAMEDFIEFKKRSDALVQSVFRDPRINFVRLAFEKFLNIDPNIVAEYLAKYLDFHLKKASQDEQQLD